MSKRTRVLIIAGLILLVSLPALAHRMRVQARVDANGLLQGQASYDSGYVAGAEVEIFAADGSLLGRTQTDAEGNFSFRIAYRTGLRIVVTDGGHRGETSISAAEMPPGLAEQGEETAAAQNQQAADPAGPGEADLAGAIDARIQGLELQVRELRDQLFLRDIIGGLGYIAGLAGVALFFLAARRRAGADQRSSGR